MFLDTSNFWLKSLFPRRLWNLKPNDDSKIIYLTFDDGPIPEVTPMVLELLDQYNAKATFFCVGDNVKKHPQIFQSLLKKGHSVGNHTFHHKNGWNTNSIEYLEDVKQCGELFKTNWFRPPYGKLRPSQAKEIEKTYTIVMWDILSRDFDPSYTPEKCTEHVIKNIKSGSIVVFHDSIKASENMFPCLRITLKTFSEQGFVFKSL
jgi:peptidoglycan-N-acetylglucosamine deacetylase